MKTHARRRPDWQQQTVTTALAVIGATLLLVGWYRWIF